MQIQKIKNHLSQLLLLIIACGIFINAHANITVPRNSPVPGGVAVLPLNQSSYKAPKVYYDDHRIMVVKNKGQSSQWYAIVGIPLSAKPGKHSIDIHPVEGLSYQQDFTIEKKTYPLVHITIEDKNKVTPNLETAKRIKQERKQIRELMQHYSNSDTVYAQFILPVNGRFSSPFGLRRIYNKTVKGRHTGLDIAAPKGTPIIAAANGKVIGTGDYVLLGNAVFVDHGRGLITFYCHMQHINVKSGQTIKQGEQLGTVGATGRVTGPHLHWGVALNDVLVNPSLFLDGDKK